MPLLTERLPVKEKLTDLQKVALFAPFFNRAKVNNTSNDHFRKANKFKVVFLLIE